MKTIRIIILILLGFVALTAIGGGIALVTGMENQRFPLSWLEGTPFKNYTLPGLLLCFVGLFNLIAFILVLIRKGKFKQISFLAGVVLVGFVLGEMILLKQNPPAPTFTEIVYLLISITTCVLSLLITK